MTHESPQHPYGTTPDVPTSTGGPSHEPRASKLTKSLVWPLLSLHIVSTIIGLLSFQSQGATDYFAAVLPPDQLAQLSPDMLETMYTAAVGFFLVFGVLNAVLFVVLGLGLRADRNWARFVGLILAILFTLSALHTLLLGTDYGNLARLELFNAIITVVIVLVTVWWILTAMKKDTSAWFALRKQLRG